MISHTVAKNEMKCLYREDNDLMGIYSAMISVNMRNPRVALISRGITTFEILKHITHIFLPPRIIHFFSLCEDWRGI